MNAGASVGRHDQAMMPLRRRHPDQSQQTQQTGTSMKKPASAPALPTRLTREPEIVIGVNSGQQCKLYNCDNGREYKAKELVKMIGVTTETLRRRIRDHGWESLKILQTPETIRSEKKAATRARRVKEVKFAEGGNGEWARLGMKTRPENFARIRPLGSWEQDELEDEHER